MTQVSETSPLYLYKALAECRQVPVGRWKCRPMFWASFPQVLPPNPRNRWKTPHKCGAHDNHYLSWTLPDPYPWQGLWSQVFPRHVCLLEKSTASLTLINDDSLHVLLQLVGGVQALDSVLQLLLLLGHFLAELMELSFQAFILQRKEKVLSGTWVVLGCSPPPSRKPLGQPFSTLTFWYIIGFLSANEAHCAAVVDTHIPQ